jgi:Ca2+-binding EF-hand superfamily protein
VTQRTRGGTDQLRKLAQLFAGNSGITRQSMRKTLKTQFNLALTESQARGLFARFDRRGQGTIELRAFVQQLMGSDVDHGSWKQVGDDGIRRAENLRQRERATVAAGPVPTTDSVPQIIRQLQDKMTQRTRGGFDQFRKIFKLFTKARGISRAEFCATVAKQFGLPLTAAQGAALFARFDANGNGEIDLREFMEQIMPKDWQREEWYVTSSKRAVRQKAKRAQERRSSLNFGEDDDDDDDEGGDAAALAARRRRARQQQTAQQQRRPAGMGNPNGTPRDRRSSVVGSLMRMDGDALAGPRPRAQQQPKLPALPRQRPRGIGASAVLGMMPPGATRDERQPAQRVAHLQNPPLQQRPQWPPQQQQPRGKKQLLEAADSEGRPHGFQQSLAKLRVRGALPPPQQGRARAAPLAVGGAMDTARSQRVVQRGAAIRTLQKLQRRIAELDARNGT